MFRGGMLLKNAVCLGAFQFSFLTIPESYAPRLAKKGPWVSIGLLDSKFCQYAATSSSGFKHPRLLANDSSSLAMWKLMMALVLVSTMAYSSTGLSLVILGLYFRSFLESLDNRRLILVVSSRIEMNLFIIRFPMFSGDLSISGKFGFGKWSGQYSIGEWSRG